jgi:uncharacterized membrane protein
MAEKNSFKMNRNLKAALVTLLIIAGASLFGWFIVTYPDLTLKIFAGLNIATVVVVVFLFVRKTLE